MQKKQIDFLAVLSDNRSEVAGIETKIYRRRHDMRRLFRPGSKGGFSGAGSPESGSESAGWFHAD